MLDFSISVRRGWADSAEIALLTAMATSQTTKRVVAEGVSKFDSVFFLVFFRNRNAKFFHLKPRHSKHFASPDSPTLPLESPEFAGPQGDNLVAWLVSCWTFFKKAFPEKIYGGWIHDKTWHVFDLFGWKVNGEPKAFLFKDVIFGVFFELKQLLLFFSTLSVFNCSSHQNEFPKEFQKK